MTVQSCHQSQKIFDVAAAPVVDNVTTSVCEGGNLGSLFLLSQSWNTQELEAFYTKLQHSFTLQKQC